MDQNLVGGGINLCAKAKSFTIAEWMTQEEMKL